MAGKATAVDPGSHTVKVLVCKDGKSGLAVTRFAAIKASDAAAGLAGTGIPLGGVVAGLAGRDMTLRYTQVPPSPDWQLRNLMELEIQDIAGQSGGELSADYNLLPVTEDSDMDTVLMALARDDALESVSQMIAGAKGSIAAHVPNCVALYNAFLRTAPVEDEEQVVCLANIGRDTTDIALVKGRDLLFARNLSSGAKVLDDAIAAQFDVSGRKAESLKKDLLDLDPDSRGRYASGMAEKVTMAATGAAGAFVSGIQSSVAFCQSQTKVQGLQLDKVLITGGGARIRGVRGMLREALRCPVEEFDPFEAVDLSGLPAGDAQQLGEMRSEAVIALGLAVTAIDEGAYSLEILPEAVKRRQRFAQRTIYNIAAGLIGALLLALAAVQGQKALAEAETAEQSVVSKSRRLQQTHDQVEKLVDDNAADHAAAAALAERSVPLHGVLRTLRALHTGNMVPPELWVTSIEVQRDKRSGGDGGAVVVLRGAIRPISGRDVGEVYREFSKRFREHELLASADVVAKVDDQSEERTTFTITIDLAKES